MIHEILYLQTEVAKLICDRDNLIAYLFSLLTCKDLFEITLGVIEEVLAVRKSAFDLSKVDGFQTLVNEMPARSLARFCRVLALLLFEPEDRDMMESSATIKSHALLKIRKRRLLRLNHTIDRNHAILLGIPEFLKRLINILNIQSTAPAINDVMGSVGSTAQALELLQIVEASMTQGVDLMHAATENVNIDQLESLQAASLSSHQVELLFVLCTLMGGKRKANVQKQLAKLDLPNILMVLVDHITWGEMAQHQSRNDAAMHGDGCDCSPEAALRVQFLRLIHNFCDGDRPPHHERLLLLSETERQWLTEDAKLTDGIDVTRADCGLLCRIISILLQEPENSNYLFWLISCIEVFLRGASNKEQRFVARTPILNFLVKEVSEDKFRTPGTLQTSYDLLGEIVKENELLLREFVETLSADQLSQFFHVISDNLVDSNVFLRAMFLVLELAAKKNPMLSLFNRSYHETNQETDGISRLRKIFSQKLIDLVHKLMISVSIDQIDHENVCCINTTLIIVILAFRHDSLADLLQAIEREKPCKENFRKLLWFWKEYYAFRGRDRLSLELSSRIPFREWAHVVDLLSADDGSPTSLL